MEALCPGENGFGQGFGWLRGDPPCSTGNDRAGEGLCPSHICPQSLRIRQQAAEGPVWFPEPQLRNSHMVLVLKGEQ